MKEEEEKERGEEEGGGEESLKSIRNNVCAPSFCSRSHYSPKPGIIAFSDSLDSTETLSISVNQIVNYCHIVTSCNKDNKIEQQEQKHLSIEHPENDLQNIDYLLHQ